MDSGGSLEVKIAIISIVTKLSWKSASVQQYAAGQWNGLLKVPRIQKYDYFHWHQATIHESLPVSQNQSQINKMDSWGSLEV
jgi:hypothetical protein